MPELVFAALGLAAALVALIPATADATFPGRNGRVTFAADGPPPGLGSRLFAVEPAGHGERALRCALVDVSGGCRDFDPAYSPDGRRLALLTTGLGAMEAGRPPRLVLAASDGARSAVYKVERDSEESPRGPAWSPDGQRVAYSVRSFLPLAPDIVTLGANGVGGGLVVREGRSPDWSSRDWIAFAGGAAVGAIYRVRPNGSGLRRLTRGAGDAPSWSPHGRQIAFERLVDKPRSHGGGSFVYIMRADGRGLCRLKTGGDAISPSWSPDGKWIAFVRPGTTRARSRLYKVRPDGRDLRLLSRRAGISHPAWQPLR